jgi:hypothetical protein
MVEADAGEAEVALNALLDDEASKLCILDHLRKWLGDNLPLHWATPCGSSK